MEDEQRKKTASETPPQAPSAETSPAKVVHHLVANDFILGPLDFVAPDLAQTHRLKAKNYTVTPWKSPGRPRQRPIPDDIKTGMVADLVTFLHELQATTPNHPIQKRDQRIEPFVRKLAEKAGVKAGYRRLKQEIVQPAFQKFRSPASR
jgi:hypothetical protein